MVFNIPISVGMVPFRLLYPVFEIKQKHQIVRGHDTLSRRIVEQSKCMNQ